MVAGEALEDSRKTKEMLTTDVVHTQGMKKLRNFECRVDFKEGG